MELEGHIAMAWSNMAQLFVCTVAADMANMHIWLSFKCFIIIICWIHVSLIVLYHSLFKDMTIFI